MNFRQFDNEHVAQAWERMKSMVKNCPTHGLTTWMVVQTFYVGLNFLQKNYWIRPPPPSSSEQSSSGALHRRVGVISFASVRRTAATIPAPPELLRLSQAPQHAQGELTVLGDLSPLPLPHWFAVSPSTRIVPPPWLIAGASPVTYWSRPAAT